jgi:hypothetical protein
MPPDPMPDLPGELRLTQYGERPPYGDGFRDRLREQIGETEISMILGEVDSSAAAILVTRYLTPGAITRVTTVERLQAAGFRVVHSPSKTNRLHVSVFPPVTAAGQPVEWDDKLAQIFNACFTDHKGGTEGS